MRRLGFAFSFCAAFLAIFAGVGVSDEGPNAAADSAGSDNIYAGIAVVATMPTTQLSVGDSVFIDVRIENRGTEALTFIDTSSETDLKIDVFDSLGRIVPWTLAGAEVQDPRIGRAESTRLLTQRLLPGHGAEYRIRMDRLYDLSLAGDYVVTIRFDAAIKKADSREWPDCQPTLRSNQVRFRLDRIPGHPPTIVTLPK